MKIRTIPALLFVVTAAPALAGSCPTLMGEIDQALADSSATAALSDSEMEQVRSLRAEGERLHKSGDHGESVAKLREAMSMLDGSGSGGSSYSY